MATMLERPATMDFIRPDSRMNRRYMAAGQEISTGKYERKDVVVRDARPKADSLTLDTAGFQLFEHSSKVTDWTSMEELNTTYANEIRDFVTKLTGADRVVVFGPVRRTTHDKKPHAEDNDWNDQPPASDVHVDYTPRRAESLSEDFAAKNGFNRKDFKHVKFINLWRAVSPGPQNWPLAVCRGDSVGDEEGVINHLLYVDRVPDMTNLPEDLPHDPMYPEGSLFTFRPTHQWMYYSNMNKNELLAFTLYDSKMQKPWRVPHCAFYNDIEGAKVRESVEIRTVCYFK